MTAATLIPSVGCPMGCNFCSTSAMFGGKGKFVDFYETGDELFDVMCQLEEAMKVRILLRDGRELPAAPQAGAAPARADVGSTTSPGRCTSSARRTFCSATRSRSWWVWGSRGCGWAWKASDSRYPKLRGIDTPRLVRTLAPTASGARLDDHRARGTHAGEHRRSHRLRREPRDGVPSVHALHAGSGHALCTRSTPRGGPCWTRASARRPTRTGSSSSTTGIRTSETARRRSSCCEPSDAISSGTARASCGWCGPRCSAGSGTGTIRRNGFASASPGKPRAWPARARVGSGPAGTGSERTPWSPRSSAQRWRRSFAASGSARGCWLPCWGGSCCSRCAGKTDACAGA